MRNSTYWRNSGRVTTEMPLVESKEITVQGLDIQYIESKSRETETPS